MRLQVFLFSVFLLQSGVRLFGQEADAPEFELDEMLEVFVRDTSQADLLRLEYRHTQLGSELQARLKQCEAKFSLKNTALPTGLELLLKTLWQNSLTEQIYIGPIVGSITQITLVAKFREQALFVKCVQDWSPDGFSGTKAWASFVLEKRLREMAVKIFD